MTHDPERMPKSERLLRVLEALRRAPHSVAELRERLWGAVPDRRAHQAIERSLQRDLEQLRRLQPGFTRLPGRPPRYHLGEQRTELPLGELLAAHAVLRAVSGSATGPHLAALARLSLWAPAHLRPALTQGLAPVGRRRTRETRNLELATQAWVGGHPLGFVWPQEEATHGARRELHIHTIEAHPHTLELRAVGLETREHRAVVAYRLAAMREVRVQTDRVALEAGAPLPAPNPGVGSGGKRGP